MNYKKNLLFFVMLLMSLGLLVSCSNRPPTGVASPSSSVQAAKDLAQTFISTYEAKNAADWLSLFSDDALFLDNGNTSARAEGPIYMHSNQTYVNFLFSLKNFSMKFNSSFVSDDGRFIALTATYTNTGADGNPASVPMEIILEVKDGKIIREDDYYDSDPFY